MELGSGPHLLRQIITGSAAKARAGRGGGSNKLQVPDIRCTVAGMGERPPKEKLIYGTGTAIRIAANKIDVEGIQIGGGIGFSRVVRAEAMSQGKMDYVASAQVAGRMVGLPRHFTTRYPHEHSGGQRQRVGIARAVALRPDFILADEIVSGLDVSSQAQVLLLLEELVRELGLTLAFISHDLSVIRRLCSKVLVLLKGEIVENVSTSDLFEQPKSAYTRSLLDAIPLPDPAQVWT